MRDIKTLTKEEVEEFLEAINLGEYEIINIKFNKKDKEWEIDVKTKWGSDTEEDPITEIVDWFTFSVERFDTSFPFQTEYDNLYREFLWAKGFRENKFKIYK